MKIHDRMSLDRLADQMGMGATRDEADAMRELLVYHYDGHDTGDIDSTTWLRLCDEAVESAREEVQP